MKPASAKGKLPTVLVVHENRGLNPHIEDVARRVALENFIAFAPDALFPLGGYPGDEDKAREQFQKLDQAKTREDFRRGCGLFEEVAAAVVARSVSPASAMAAVLPTSSPQSVPDLAAAVPFYGTPPAPEEASKHQGAVVTYSSRRRMSESTRRGRRRKRR